jgi:enoyl-[acyl-carrier protein] reductase II
MLNISEILGCKYPIIQGAMAGISNPELVAAVSEAGGYGLLATVFHADPETLRLEIRRTKELTDKPFGANLSAWNKYNADIARVLSEEGVKVITFSGGSPKPYLSVFKELGIEFIAVTSNVQTAVKTAELGAVAVVAEGSESGGAQGGGGSSTLVLIPEVADAVDIPVIAAGGIADARSYRAVRALGAQGVQIGTRFVAAEECIAHQAYKDAIVAAKDGDTGLINMGPFFGRVLKTPLTEELIVSQESAAKWFTPAATHSAMVKGDLAAGLIAAGQVAGSIHKVLTVREIIEEMVAL